METTVYCLKTIGCGLIISRKPDSLERNMIPYIFDSPSLPLDEFVIKTDHGERWALGQENCIVLKCTVTELEVITKRGFPENKWQIKIQKRERPVQEADVIPACIRLYFGLSTLTT